MRFIIVEFTEHSGKLLVLLLHNGEVPGSNAGPDTGYHDRYFVVFLSPSRKKLG
jgi:hypothetical protein